MPEIASKYKVTYHSSKIASYLGGTDIFPACLELDLTAACNRSCPLCPSTKSHSTYALNIRFIKWLFSVLERQTRGLLLTGGEPTLSPAFSETLQLARRCGFVDIAVVTNGLLLNREEVAEALLANASTIRVSLYDWIEENNPEATAAFRRIEELRRKVDRTGSHLQIGVSVLTSQDNAAGLSAVTRRVGSAGAHWIYFHPRCIRWDVAAPSRVDQQGVSAALENVKLNHNNGLQVFTFPERYIETSIEFHGYHAAHFLLVIGADGLNYLGAEVKYHHQHVISDVSGQRKPDFLWAKERLAHIRSVESSAYPPLGSRHRGVLYSDLIQKLLKRENCAKEELPLPEDGFAFPHIL